MTETPDPPPLGPLLTMTVADLPAIRSVHGAQDCTYVMRAPALASTDCRRCGLPPRAHVVDLLLTELDAQRRQMAAQAAEIARLTREREEEKT